MITWEKILSFAENSNPKPPRRVEKTLVEWQALLSAEQFHITRQAGTERPFSGAHCSTFSAGQYQCVCCDALLFDADSQFYSSSGWASFIQPAAENAIAYRADHSHGMVRVECICNVCDAHLGHVFPDGPPPTQLRYCMNSLALVKHD